LAHSSPFLSPVTIPQVVAENVFSVNLPGKIRVKRCLGSRPLSQHIGYIPLLPILLFSDHTIFKNLSFDNKINPLV
jgi:hypothetical protein